MTTHSRPAIAILDFGSQYSQLIARRVRELQVFSELFPWDTPAEEILRHDPQGFILSGGPASVYDSGAPQIPAYVLESGLPVLGICYGMQALTYALGGQVAASSEREYGPAQLETTQANPLLGDQPQLVWMSHGDRIEALPPGFSILAQSDHSPAAAMGDLSSDLLRSAISPGSPSHPRRKRNLAPLCPRYLPGRARLDAHIHHPGKRRAHSPAGGQGAGAYPQSAVGSIRAWRLPWCSAPLATNWWRSLSIPGCCARAKPRQVQAALHENLGVELITVDAAERFLSRSAGGQRARTKTPDHRRAVYPHFRRTSAPTWPAPARRFLVQGTIYPDVVESSAPDRSQAQRIKTHHNVGGLPEDMQFELVEPLRYLFKDEVRAGWRSAWACRPSWSGGSLSRARAWQCAAWEKSPRSVWSACAPRMRSSPVSWRSADCCFSAAGSRPAPRGTAQAFAVLLPVQIGGRDGRSAHLPRGRSLARSHHRGFYDRRLGAFASTTCWRAWPTGSLTKCRASTGSFMTLPANPRRPLNGNKGRRGSRRSASAAWIG